MLKRASTIFICALAAFGLVLGLDYATYAGTGDSLILGRVNKAGKPTVVKNTGAGPALSLKSRSSAPPLAVSSGKKVVRLNADLLDGLDSSSLANNTRRYSYTSTALQTGPTTFRIAGVPAGTYLLTLRASVQPAGGTPGNPSNVQCVVLAGGAEYGGDMGLYTGGFWVILTGADVLRLTAPTNVDVSCAANVGQYSFQRPLVVTLTNVSLTTNGALPKLP